MRTATGGSAHYKLTRTVTGADGKTRTETIEMADDDAVKVGSSLYAADASTRQCVSLLSLLVHEKSTDPSR